MRLHSYYLFYKILPYKASNYLYNKLTFRTEVDNLNLRFRGVLTPPVHLMQHFKRCFLYNIIQSRQGYSQFYFGSSVQADNINSLLLHLQGGGKRNVLSGFNIFSISPLLIMIYNLLLFFFSLSFFWHLFAFIVGLKNSSFVMVRSTITNLSSKLYKTFHNIASTIAPICAVILLF